MTDIVSPAPAGRPRLPGSLSLNTQNGSQPRPIPPRNTSAALLDLTSPVNQNGSFEFDRVLKHGDVSKRSRRTKQWKRFYLVLRPNLLSIYKNSSEEKLHKQINLSDLSAVAVLKDPKGRREHLFGLFSPARNYHFQASTDEEARRWVELISREARIDEEEDLMILGSPTADAPLPSLPVRTHAPEANRNSRLSTSSPEPLDASSPYTTRDGVRIPGIRRTSFQEMEYSGNEHASYSDFSDTAPSRAYPGPSSAPVGSVPTSSIAEGESLPATTNSPNRPRTPRNPSQMSANATAADDDERVIWHGYLLALKSKGRVRQWKKLWMVVRRKNVAFYKNEDEYSAHLIIPMSNIISAVEIDPISRSKAHCLQIIAEEKSYRFCAREEESLLRCLGAIKSQLARRKERENARRVGA